MYKVIASALLIVSLSFSEVTKQEKNTVFFLSVSGFVMGVVGMVVSVHNREEREQLEAKTNALYRDNYYLTMKVKELECEQ